MSNPVISPAAPQWSAIGAGVSTVAVAPFSTGDLLVLAFYANGGPATAVSGGGVTTWTCASSYYDTTGSGAYAGIWWGAVAATGSGTVTVTDAGQGTDYGKLWVREFTATGANWSVVAASPAAGATGGTPGTTGTPAYYPGLSPSGSGNLYVGAGWSYFGHLNAGSDAGFYYANPAADGPEMIAYNWSVSTAVTPSAANTDGTYLAVAAMFTAGGGTVTSPVYASSYGIISGGLGNWVNPANAEGPPDGSFATWVAP